MSERERWIVYPLLFLALGASLRDKLVDRTTAKSIVCEELTVVGKDSLGQQPFPFLAKIGRVESASGSPAYGFLVLNGQMEVNGEVNAQQYAFKGVPFLPAIHSVFPISPSDLFRSLQQSIQTPPQTGRPSNETPEGPDVDQSTPPQAPAANSDESNSAATSLDSR